MTGGSTTFNKREKLEREGRRGVKDTAVATLEQSYQHSRVHVKYFSQLFLFSGIAKGGAAGAWSVQFVSRLTQS